MISLHACRLGARHSSDEGCPRSYGHRTGICANCAAGQLASDRAVPARQGDQIAAAINGHPPGGTGKRRQIRPSEMAGNGHVLRIPRHAGRQTRHARPRRVTASCHQTCHREMALAGQQSDGQCDSPARQRSAVIQRRDPSELQTLRDGDHRSLLTPGGMRKQPRSARRDQQALKLEHSIPAGESDFEVWACERL